MRQLERTAALEDAVRVALGARQAMIWTCLPGIIESVNFAAQTAVVQVAIQGQTQNQDGTWSNVDLKPLVDCPIKFPNGGGFSLTFPISTGDECEVTFSSRCFDAWWQQGGVQPQAEFRMHDLSDGFVEVGPRSQPRVIPNISATTAQLRSDDGVSYVELAAGHVVNVVAPGGINLNGVHIDGSGNITAPGTVTATGEVTANGGHTLSGHRHGGVAAGSAQTATPTG